MWEEILNLAISNGIWAVLFLLLLIYQLKDSREREVKYQKTISSLSGSLSEVNKVHELVLQTHEVVKTLDGNVKKLLTKKPKKTTSNKTKKGTEVLSNFLP